MHLGLNFVVITYPVTSLLNMDEETFNGFDHIWYYRIGLVIIYTPIFNTILPIIIDLGKYMLTFYVQLKDRKFK